MFMNILDSIIVPVVLLNGMAIAAIVAIALGTSRPTNYRVTDAATSRLPERVMTPQQTMHAAANIAPRKTAKVPNTPNTPNTPNIGKLDIPTPGRVDIYDKTLTTDDAALAKASNALFELTRQSSDKSTIALQDSPRVITTVMGIDIYTNAHLRKNSSGSFDAWL